MTKEPVMTLSMPLKPKTYEATYNDYRKAKLENPKLTWDTWMQKKLGIYIEPY